jgi:hypothetical protein
VADRTGADLAAHMSWRQCRDEQLSCRGSMKVLPCHVNPLGAASVGVDSMTR